jgi:signal transduction histidine kinase
MMRKASNHRAGRSGLQSRLRYEFLKQNQPMDKTLPDTVTHLRNELLDQTLFWLGIISLPAVALSLTRIPIMGLRPVFIVHIVLTGTMWLFWWQRHRLPFSWRLGIALLALATAGLGGYAQHGPAAVAGQFLLLFLVIAAVFMERRAVFRVTGYVLTGLVLVAWGAISGGLDFELDYRTYAHSASTWGLLIFAVAGYGGGVAYVVSSLFQRLIDHEQLLSVANTELAQRTEEAEDHSKLKGEILSNLSHEFRTPLNGILGMADLLAMDETDTERRAWIEDLQGSAKRLGVVLDRMLDFVALGDGKVMMRHNPFDPCELAQAACRRVGLRAEQKGLSLRMICDPETPGVVDGDGHRLQQLLGELLDNAVNYTAQGGIEVRLRPATAPAEDPRIWLQIDIVDSGPGIPADLRELVFEPFRQLDGTTTREVGGNGPGLAICRRIAHLLGGEISLAGTPGGGSTFSATLPFAPDED